MSASLIALKAKLAPTSLHTFLAIYRKSGNLCYIDYMQGARALASYLSPISIPIPANPSAPIMLRSYELQKLAAILSSFPEGMEGANETNMREWNMIMAAIVETEMKEVL